MAHYVTTDGDVKTVTPKNGKTFDLEEMQGYVGGLIEMIYLTADKIMIINEEGKLCNLDLNILATRVAYQHQAIWQNDYVVGNVLVCDDSELN